MRAGPLGLLAALACGDGAPEPPAGAHVAPAEVAAGPATARWDMVDMLRDDLQAPRHASDGGGQALLLEGGAVTAGLPGRWRLAYEAGPLGIAEGGMVFLQVSPFWGWSTPQVLQADAPGYTTVHTGAEGVRLEPATLGDQLLGIRVTGRALRARERVELVYGAGPAGATADRYAESASSFWFSVDGDGDGVRGLVPGPPAVAVLPGPPAGVIATLPSTAAPGAPVALRIAPLDARGNASPMPGVPLTIEVEGPGLELPPHANLPEGAPGVLVVTGRATAEGLHRVVVREPGGAEFRSNPLLVSSAVPPIRWGDIHGHSAASDGTGTPAEWYRYARDVAGLDFAALTDHDHWGMRFLDQSPDLWAEIRATVQDAHVPGQFVAILGYEWTSWIHGHRHVLFFEDDGPLLSSVDPATDEPAELWAALEGTRALTILHHPAGGPVPGHWDAVPDPAREPVVEVVSVHGCSEAPDCPGLIYSAVEGRFARDALDRGLRLGFTGSGDGHDGHPGLAWLSSPQGGLVAAPGATPTREGIRQALVDRRVYATNGPRILLLATVDGHPMGSVIPPGSASLRVIVAGTGPVAGVDLVRRGRDLETWDGGDAVLLEHTFPLADLAAGDWLYVRVRQADGGVAMGSPFFVGP